MATPLVRYARMLTIVSLVGGLLMLVAAASAEVPRKKLIKVGHDFPRPSYVAEHIQEMEKEPFDGIIMDLRPMSNPFTRMRWDESWDHRWAQALWDGKWNQEQWAAELAALERIEWNKFTDNFIVIKLDLATSETEGRGVVMADWFSDDDWDAVLHNVGLLAHAAQVGRCRVSRLIRRCTGLPSGNTRSRNTPRRRASRNTPRWCASGGLSSWRRFRSTSPPR